MCLLYSNICVHFFSIYPTINDTKISSVLKEYRDGATQKPDIKTSCEHKKNEPEMGKGMKHVIDLSDDDKKSAWYYNRINRRDNDFER